MKKLLLFALVFAAIPASAQISYPYILNPPTVAPSGACAGPQIQVLGSNGAIYSCNNGTWAAASGGGTGTVTSVTGTANQIDVATGTTTPVLSLSSSLILPTGATLVAPLLGTPASGVITNLTGTCTACTSNAVTGLSVTAGKTLTVSNSLTFIGTDGNTLTFPSGNSTVVTTAGGQTIAGTTTFSTGVSTGSLTASSFVSGARYVTTTNCAVNSVSPAACSAAAAGAFVVPTTTTTYTVNTTAARTASRIMLMPLSFASNLPSTPTCVAPAVTSVVTVSAIVDSTSFTIALPTTTGQTCFFYTIVD